MFKFRLTFYTIFVTGPWCWRRTKWPKWLWRSHWYLQERRPWTSMVLPPPCRPVWGKPRLRMCPDLSCANNHRGTNNSRTNQGAYNKANNTTNDNNSSGNHCWLNRRVHWRRQQRPRRRSDRWEPLRLVCDGGWWVWQAGAAGNMDNLDNPDGGDDLDCVEISDRGIAEAWLGTMYVLDGDNSSVDSRIAIAATRHEQPLLLQPAEMAGCSLVQRQVQGDQQWYWQPEELYLICFGYNVEAVRLMKVINVGTGNAMSSGPWTYNSENKLLQSADGLWAWNMKRKGLRFNAKVRYLKDKTTPWKRFQWNIVQVWELLWQ